MDVDGKEPRRNAPHCSISSPGIHIPADHPTAIGKEGCIISCGHACVFCGKHCSPISLHSVVHMRGNSREGPRAAVQPHTHSVSSNAALRRAPAATAAPTSHEVLAPSAGEHTPREQQRRPAVSLLPSAPSSRNHNIICSRTHRTCVTKMIRRVCRLCTRSDQSRV